MARRYAESRIDATETRGGVLRVTATPTRVGVFEYKRADGSIVRELRAPEEVFHADSLASLEDVAVTIGHPPGDTFTPDMFATRATGHVRAGTVRADTEAGVVRAGLAVTRADAVALAAQKPFLSAGYGCVINPTPGVWNGQPFDQSQTQIRYNHVSMIEPGRGLRPRGGIVCRLDSDDNEVTDPTDPGDARADASEKPMKIKIGEKTYDNEAEAQAEVTKLAARADAAEAQVTALTQTVARADAEKAVSAHAALVAQVKGIMGATFPVTRKDAAGVEVPLSARELRVAVIKRADAAFDDSKAEDLYVVARFDATLATSSKAADVIAALNGANPAARADATPAPDRAEALRNQCVATARKAGASVTE